jgi:hypothetical protein
MTNSLPRSHPGWGKKLVEALTKDQVETLLDVLVGAGDPLRLSEELRIFDSDLADTVQRLVGEADTVAAKDSDAAVSKQSCWRSGTTYGDAGTTMFAKSATRMANTRLRTKFGTRPISIRRLFQRISKESRRKCSRGWSRSLD